jgi:hypothetical protein
MAEGERRLIMQLSLNLSAPAEQPVGRTLRGRANR